MSTGSQSRADRLRELEQENERLTGLIDCDLDATTRHANALEDENERLRRRLLEQAHTLSAASRNTLQDRLADIAAERDKWKARAEEAAARLAKLAALEQRARRELVKRDFKGAAVVLADDIRAALAPSEDGQQ